MAHFNAKKTPVVPTETNFMGEMAYKLSDKEELVSTVMTTFLHDGYYESEKEVVDRIVGLLDTVDPVFAAKLALYARNEGNLRSVTHLIASTISGKASGTDWGKRFYNKIVVRPDDMSEILSCFAEQHAFDQKHIRKIPNAIRKGFKAALERLDAYQIDKYKMNNRSVSMIDLVNLLHPKATKKNAEAYKRLLNGESLDGLYETKILEKTMSAAGKNATTQEEKAVAKEEAITEVLSNVKGMPVMNLLRNLRNIILYAPAQVDEACRQLCIEKKILDSRLLPFRFATAYSETEAMSYEASSSTKTDIEFEGDKNNGKLTRKEFESAKQKVLDAIENAIQISCRNIPKLEGNTAILIDHSGSVRGDAGGASRVSAFSKTTTAMIGNLFGSMLAYRQDNVYVGLFGNRLISVPMDRSKKLLDFNKESYALGDECGGATESGIYKFFKTAIAEKKKIDNIVIFSDCQIGTKTTKDYVCRRGIRFTPWYGTGSEQDQHFHELFKQFKKINPNANVIVCNVKQAGGTSVFDKSQRILNIAGWSDKIFDVITSNCKGWDAVIKEIESIEL